MVAGTRVTAPRLVAGVELGGTKSIAVLARGAEILERIRCATTTPEETLGFLRDQIQTWNSSQAIASLGIASFGPICLDAKACDYGSMLTTPKQGWTGAKVGEQLTRGLRCPWRIDTDVNSAALAEWKWGAAQGQSVVCYLTIGTGVGGGVLVDGRPLHGALHPELGHLRLRRTLDDTFRGLCPFHGDCIEGLISGPALSARFGFAVGDLSDDDPRWGPAALDLAELLAAIVLGFSPSKILIGGGVGLGHRGLLNRARPALLDRLAGYLPGVNAASVKSLIEHASLGSEAGPLGAIALAHLALDGSASFQNSKSVVR